MFSSKNILNDIILYVLSFPIHELFLLTNWKDYLYVGENKREREREKREKTQECISSRSAHFKKGNARKDFK